MCRYVGVDVPFLVIGVCLSVGVSMCHSVYVEPIPYCIFSRVRVEAELDLGHVSPHATVVS